MLLFQKKIRVIPRSPRDSPCIHLSAQEGTLTLYGVYVPYLLLFLNKISHTMKLEVVFILTSQDTI